MKKNFFNSNNYSKILNKNKTVINRLIKVKLNHHMKNDINY